MTTGDEPGLTSRAAQPPRHLASTSEGEANVHRLVLSLNAICKSATLSFALCVGQLVIRELYGGDTSRFRSRQRKQDAALRKVATHPDLAMSPSMLYGCIGIYELSERLGIRSWRHISTSHMRLVLPLPPDSQLALLRDAEANRWPVRRLEQEIATLAHARDSRGGRRRQSRLHRATSLLHRDVSAVADALDELDNPAADSSPESTRRAFEVLQRVAELCTSCQGRILERGMPLAEDAPTVPRNLERGCQEDAHCGAGRMRKQ